MNEVGNWKFLIRLTNIYLYGAVGLRLMFFLGHDTFCFPKLVVLYLIYYRFKCDAWQSESQHKRLEHVFWINVKLLIRIRNETSGQCRIIKILLCTYFRKFSIHIYVPPLYRYSMMFILLPLCPLVFWLVL
jgi:hypothetical protein